MGDKEPITAKSIFNVEMMETDSETVSENLTGWRITSLTSREVKIALTFENPLEVSQGDERDALLVFANLG